MVDICAVMAAIELHTPQGAEMVSGMIYEPHEPDEQGVIMRLEHHLVGGYVRYISPHIIIIKEVLYTGFVDFAILDCQML